MAHGPSGRVAYDPEINEEGLLNRSRKLAALQTTLRLAPVFGDDEGDLLLIGWGSTKGAIEEAVDRMRGQGASVSSLFLAFLSPLQPGLKAIFSRYRKVMTVELNYSDKKTDPLITPENRRYSQLATVLRAATLVDVDCWSRVPGRPLMPSEICEVIAQELAPETVSA